MAHVWNLSSPASQLAHFHSYNTASSLHSIPDIYPHVKV
jgi:hypothetical protein